MKGFPPFFPMLKEMLGSWTLSADSEDLVQMLVGFELKSLFDDGNYGCYFISVLFSFLVPGLCK